MKTLATHVCGRHNPAIMAAAMTQSNDKDRSLLGHHQFLDPETDEAYGSFLIFEHAPGKLWLGFGEEPFEHGFYWQSVFPGCLPDRDSSGPFKTCKAAYNDAQFG